MTFLGRLEGYVRRYRDRRRSAASKEGYDDQFVAEFSEFNRKHIEAERAEPIGWSDRYVCLGDRSEYTGFDRHYIYHPAWAARIIAKTNPKFHTDISSSLTFCSIVSAFVRTEFYDFRPAPLFLDNLTCGRADLLNLPFADDSLSSLSCMHVIEHIGLGRYGDPLDATGDLKALHELSRVLAPGGNLLIAVPVGRERVQFNAHRIYDHARLLTYLPDLQLQEFALVPDGFVPDGLIENPTKAVVDQQEYGCGCYWFTKR